MPGRIPEAAATRRCPTAEIAEQLNISVKTVEAQITKALKAIRSYITDKMVLLCMFF